MLAQRNPAGETLAEGIERIGGRPETLAKPLHAAGSTAAFVELHLEQGSVLETNRLTIGIVTQIAGIRRFRVIVEGKPDKSAPNPIDIRRSALGSTHRNIEESRSRTRNKGARND